MRRSIITVLVVLIVGASLAAPRYIQDGGNVRSREVEVNNDSLAFETLVQVSDSFALAEGLTTVEYREYAYLTRGEWFSQLGVLDSALPPDVMLLVVSYKGKGEIDGFGSHYLKENGQDTSMDGVTVAINMITGQLEASVTGYRNLSQIEAKSYNYLERPVLAPDEPHLLPEQTPDPQYPTSPGPLPVPPLP